MQLDGFGGRLVWDGSLGATARNQGDRKQSEHYDTARQPSD
jgi:hypothetical protein